MQITLIGHSTVLIEVGGRRILTDPYFGSRGNLAYKRVTPASSSGSELADVDVVLISHNHWDHVDRRFLGGLSSTVPVVAPRRSRWLTRLKGAKSPIGMTAWDEEDFGPVRITAVPALHIALTIGFVIQALDAQVYFAGDTYHRPFMRDIGRKFDLDVALMPVTTYRLPMTMGEAGAVRAVRDLRPPWVIPIHLALQPRQPLLRTPQTPERFARRVRESGLQTEVVILAPGDRWSPPARTEGGGGT